MQNERWLMLRSTTNLSILNIRIAVLPPFEMCLSLAPQFHGGHHPQPHFVTQQCGNLMSAQLHPSSAASDLSATGSRGPIWGTSPTATSQRSKCTSSDPWSQPYSDIIITKYGYVETSLYRNPADNTLDFGTLFAHRPEWISNRSWKPKLDPLGP